VARRAGHGDVIVAGALNLAAIGNELGDELLQLFMVGFGLEACEAH
jgi:hypothetical protein